MNRSRPRRWWRRKQTGWYTNECKAPAWLEDRGEVDPSQIAGLYRALRKGLEDSKNEPGTADFYYGEMEMRRHAPSTGRAERWILGAYWLVSGYALRTWRALAALAFVVLVCAALFDQGGLKDASEIAPRIKSVAPNGAVQFEGAPAAEPPDFLDAFTFSLGTTAVVIGVPERPLTKWGAVLRILLRVLGPLLIALALVSIRSRVNGYAPSTKASALTR